MISSRENYLRSLEFRSPEWIPVLFDLGGSTWMKYGRSLEEIVLRHPRIFEDYIEDSYPREAQDPFFKGEAYTRDDWGCLWYCPQAGMLGQVIEHPLADWSAFNSFQPPDPAQQFDWRRLREQVEDDRRRGRLTRGTLSITQGGFFDRLQFLRGLENLLIDFAEHPPQLDSLMERVLDYNLQTIRLWLEIGVDQFCFHGDIGTQTALLFSPKTFRRYLKPAYTAMFSACRQAGAHVWYSSDGHLLELVDDLIECGATLHDPQIGPNPLEDIARVYKGKLCALVDINEQLNPFCQPEDIHSRIRNVMEMMGDARGGLMLYIGCNHDTPLENIGALCDAVEHCCF